MLLADLHTHTVRSFDGRQTIQQLAAAAKSRGLQAVAVTDHGEYSPLPEQLDGVLLIPGCEFFTDIGHITGLFLPERPNTEKMTAQQAIDEIHRLGGVAVLAHPFERASITEEHITVRPDCIEGANARADCKGNDGNRKAMQYAEKTGIPTVGGSDAHSACEVGNAYTEIDCSQLTAAAIKEALLSGRCRGVLKKNTPHRLIGLSQLKRRRSMGGIKNLIIGILFLIKCLLRDIKEK